jgi:hypothetical protein
MAADTTRTQVSAQPAASVRIERPAGPESAAEFAGAESQVSETFARADTAGRARLVLRLQRRIGNAQVQRLVSDAMRASVGTGLVSRAPPVADPEVARVAKLKADYKAAISAPDWDKAAGFLNTFNEPDIRARVKKLDHGQLIKLATGALNSMPGYAKRVLDYIAEIDSEAVRVGQLEFDYQTAVKSSTWDKAAELLNAFNDIDIDIRLKLLSVPQLVSLKNAAAAWITRVITPIKGLLALAASGEMKSMLGKRMTWVPSGPGSADTFEKWASAATEAAAPPLVPATLINCWEVVLLAAFRAGVLPWKWIHDTYTRAGSGWAAYLASQLIPSGKQVYNRANAAAPAPANGNIVLFDGVNHVAMATGSRDGTGRSEVMSFWPPPDVPGGAGTIDRVKVTTIEQLMDAMGPTTRVEFGPPPW